MTRLRAFQIRLIPTATALLIVTAVTYLLWFPGPYSDLAGIGKIVLIMVAVNLVVGPGLTAFVYKQNKRGLVFDLVVIAAVELAALSWAVHAIYLRQPVYTVFAVDRFEVVTRPEIDRSQVAYPLLGYRPGHTPRLVYAELPQDPEVKAQLMDDVLFNGAADIDRRPEFWRPYPSGIEVLKARARSLSKLLVAGDERAPSVRRWLNSNDANASDYLFLPLRGRSGDAVMVVHADIGYPVDVLEIDPW